MTIVRALEGFLWEGEAAGAVGAVSLLFQPTVPPAFQASGYSNTLARGVRGGLV